MTLRTEAALGATLLKMMEVPSDPPAPISRELVHKAQDQNVVISHVRRVGDDEFLAQIIVDTTHPFFFEHEVDHAPALLLVEAARQAAVAAAHVFYDIPLDTAFAFKELAMSFQKYAHLRSPLFIRVLTEEKAYRGERLTLLRVRADFLQDGQPVGTSSGTSHLVWWSR